MDQEIYNYRKDGTGFWNDLHLRPVFDGQGKLLYYFGSQADVSYRKEASRRLAQRNESLNALSSGIAHEFNNLMAIVMGNVEQVANRVTDERHSKPLNRALWAAQRAGRLTADLLSLAGQQASPDQVVGLNARSYSLADACLSCRIGFRPLKKSAILPYDISGFVAGHLRKGGVTVDQRTIRQIWISDGHRHAGLIDRGMEDVMVGQPLLRGGKPIFVSWTRSAHALLNVFRPSRCLVPAFGGAG